MSRKTGKMKKLKTQKELFEEHLKLWADSRRALEFQVKERREAIKWIKAIDNDREQPLKFSILTTKWIKHFFGIIDEDLK